MRIYNPIYPSIKDRLEELFGKPPTSITLTSYSAQYSIADQGVCKIKGYVYPQDTVNQQVLITYTSQKGDSTLIYSINYGEDSTGKYFEISVSTTTEDVYSITVKAKGSQSVQADIFTLTAVSEVQITSIEITKIAPTIDEITVGGNVILSVSIIPTNYTENISVYGTINGAQDTEYIEIEKTESNGYQMTFTTSEAGSFNYGVVIIRENGEKQTQGYTIKVKKVITPMTDSELTAHLEERRYENLISSSHFESIDQLASFVEAKDFHDIYIGDYIEINLPWIYWNSSRSSMTVQSLSATTKLRVVDINYLLDKNANITANHLVLWPDTIIGAVSMSEVGGNYSDEYVQIGSSMYSRGRGYYNNYMINTALPYVKTQLGNLLGSTHLLSYTDSVPVYYSQNYQGGTLNQVQYLSQANTYLRLPNSIVYGYSNTDKNSIWTQAFRLLQTDSSYGDKITPSGATVSDEGTLTTDLDTRNSSLQKLSWIIRNGAAGRYTYGIEEGEDPICPIIIFG